MVAELEHSQVGQIEEIAPGRLKFVTMAEAEVVVVVKDLAGEFVTLGEMLSLMWRGQEVMSWPMSVGADLALYSITHSAIHQEPSQASVAAGYSALDSVAEGGPVAMWASSGRLLEHVLVDSADWEDWYELEQ